MSKPEKTDSPDERVQNSKLVEDALARGVRDALRHHKLAGNPVPEWRDGQVRWLAPEEILDVTVASDEPALQRVDTREPTDSRLLTDLVTFVFGWGDDTSSSWEEFRRWMTQRAGAPVPSWVEHLTPNRRSRELWTQFSPEDDPEEGCAKEAYRGWLKELFEDLVGRAQEPDRNLFWAYEQLGADPLRVLYEFKSTQRIGTWAEVIRVLGNAFLSTRVPLDAPYNRAAHGTLDCSFWQSVRANPIGTQLVEVLQRTPMGGGKGWSLTFQLLQACGMLTRQDLTFSMWIAREGLARKLESGPLDDAVRWREHWSGSPSARWEPPRLSMRLPGVGPNTLEYILRDLAFPGSRHLFKLDSTNEQFVAGLLNVPTPLSRATFGESLNRSGILDIFPMAAINIALYAAVSTLEVFWEDNGLQSYRFLPPALRLGGSAALL